MIKINEKEQLKLFKTAQEQLEVRIHNSKGTSTDSLINTVFNKLDIETLCPKFIKAKRDKARELENNLSSEDVVKRMKGRNIVKKDRDIEVWIVSESAGPLMELRKLKRTFKNIKRGRSG
ncbi:MAG: hypothetical protein GY821_12580 [Gammaproteobacteria bacterium]|nr:hypothetical protein [Gammaproteobacteria bacterium]